MFFIPLRTSSFLLYSHWVSHSLFFLLSTSFSSAQNSGAAYFAFASQQLKYWWTWSGLHCCVSSIFNILYETLQAHLASLAHTCVGHNHMMQTCATCDASCFPPSRDLDETVILTLLHVESDPLMLPWSNTDHTVIWSWEGISPHSILSSLLLQPR